MPSNTPPMSFPHAAAARFPAGVSFPAHAPTIVASQGGSLIDKCKSYGKIIAILAVVAAIIYFYWRSRKRKKQKQELDLLMAQRHEQPRSKDRQPDASQDPNFTLL